MSDTHLEAPFYFGPSERPLFGFLHTPNTNSTAIINQAVVVCQPFGYEAVCAYRSTRHLAHALASHGIPTLRFDYDGVGDSAGSDLDPDRVASWVNSIVIAVEELRRRTGAQNIFLIGIRLGATLAALAALKVSSASRPIAGIAAIAPVVSGRAYLRELRALQMALRLPESPELGTESDVTEALGFAITAATKDAIQRIDLKSATDLIAANILLVDRHDMPANDAWANTLRDRGCNVQHLKLPGYTEMMLDPHKSVVPSTIWSAVVEWLVSLQTKHDSNATATKNLDRQLLATQDSRTTARMTPTTESRAVYLDTQQQLFGILTTAANSNTSISSDALLILNAGAIHRIGPNRMFVKLARQMAGNGLSVLRLDISGIGDSKPHAGEDDNVVYTKYANEDIATAVQFLASRGAKRIFSVGLCSGAYNGFKAAAHGVKLDGVVLINPLTFFWNPSLSLDFPAHQVAEDAARYRQNAFQLKSWLKLLRGQVDVAHAVQVVVRKIGTNIAGHWRNGCRVIGIPLKEDLGTELLAISNKNSKLRFIFAAGEPGLEILRVQGGSVVPKLIQDSSLTIQIIDGPDHTFTALWAQSKIIEVLLTLIGELR